MISSSYLILLVHLSSAYQVTKHSFKMCLPTHSQCDNDNVAHDQCQIVSLISKRGCAVLCSSQATCSSFKYNGHLSRCITGTNCHELPEAMVPSPWNMYAKGLIEVPVTTTFAALKPSPMNERVPLKEATNLAMTRRVANYTSSMPSTPPKQLCPDGEGYSDGFCFKLQNKPFGHINAGPTSAYGLEGITESINMSGYGIIVENQCNSPIGHQTNQGSEEGKCSKNIACFPVPNSISSGKKIDVHIDVTLCVSLK